MLDDYEAEARQRAWQLVAQGKLPNPQSNRGKDDTDIVDKLYPLTPTEHAELKRLKHALAAAPDADTFVALAKGEAVHPSHLNPEHRRSL